MAMSWLPHIDRDLLSLHRRFISVPFPTAEAGPTYAARASEGSGGGGRGWRWRRGRRAARCTATAGEGPRSLLHRCGYVHLVHMLHCMIRDHKL